MKLVLALFGIAVAAVMADYELPEVLVQGNDQFTAKMFNEVVKKNKGKSVVLSAFSVLTPLAQLALASSGASHDELLRAIGMPNDNVTKEVFSQVNSKLRSVKGVDLRTASRVYVAQGHKLNEDFAVVSRDVFQSEAKNVDFTQNQETAAEINKWVEDNTNNRIKDLVSADSLNVDTRAVLVNAIYFKGKWQDPFSKEETADSDFHVTKEKTIQVPTMHRKGSYLYTESKELNAKILEIPYEGYETSFLVILPNEIDGLEALEEKLQDPSALKKATENMFTYDVDVKLPKFKIETTTDLKDVLEKLDVKKLFSPGEAQLTNLVSGEDIFVSKATQKAFIEVNEEGAEAAAANEFGIVATSLIINPSSEFIADHPFVFALKKTDTVLFNGVFYSPKSEE